LVLGSYANGLRLIGPCFICPGIPVDDELAIVTIDTMAMLVHGYFALGGYDDVFDCIQMPEGQGEGFIMLSHQDLDAVTMDGSNQVRVGTLV
jgi:hypothetical protein